MSRVFLFSDLVEGRVPKLGDFERILWLLRRRLPLLSNFKGAVIFGSAPDRPNRASDIDVLVTFAEGEKFQPNARAQAGLRRLTKIADRLHIPIGWLPNTTYQLAHGLHAIRAEGLDHIRWAAEQKGRVIGLSPFPHVSHHGQREREVVEYLLSCMDTLTRAQVSWTSLSESARNKARAEALRRPVATARHRLCLTDREARGWDNAKVVEKTGHPILTELGELRKTYIELVEQQLVEPNQERYQEFLEQQLDGRALALAQNFFAHLLEDYKKK